jgi:hypothetical protein
VSLFSTRIAALPAGTLSDSYEVPAGFVVVLRCLFVANVSGMSDTVSLTETSPYLVMLQTTIGVDEGGYILQDFRIVVPAGKTILLANAFGVAQAVLSGYLLSV